MSGHNRAQRGRRRSYRSPRANTDSPAHAARVAGRALGNARRFGVELEFFGIARYTVETAIRNGDLPRGWRVKSDPSVHGGRGLELVSPPLSGDEGLAQVRTACEWLTANGGRVDRSAGLHVHHDAADLGAEGIARMARMYADNQSLINYLVSPSRRGHGYARPLTSGDVDYIDRSLGVGSGRYIAAPTRYLALNVTSFGRHGTVEIRQHQGTLNYRKVEAWIAFGQGLCDAAAEARTVNATGIRGLLDAIRVDEDNAAFLIGRAVQFGCSAIA